MGVQSFDDPWSRLLAILTPGIGYLAGHGLELILRARSEADEKRRRTRHFSEKIEAMRASIEIIERELDRVQKGGYDQSVIAEFQKIRDDAHQACEDPRRNP